jgi:hypothetical protein
LAIALQIMTQQRFVKLPFSMMTLIMVFMAGCGESSDWYSSEAATASRRQISAGLQIRIEGLGTFPIDFNMSVEIPLAGGTAVVYLEESVPVPDGWSVLVDGIFPDDRSRMVPIDEAPPFSMLDVSGLSFWLSCEDRPHLDLITMIDFSVVKTSYVTTSTKQVIHVFPDIPAEPNGQGAKQQVVETWTDDKVFENGFKIPITSWNIIVDRRRKGLARYWINLMLEARDHTWLDPDVSDLALSIIHSGLAGRFSWGGPFLQPWLPVEPGRQSLLGNDRESVTVLDSWSKNEEGGIRIGCLVEVNWQTGGPLTKILISGKYKYLSDQAVGGATIVEREIPNGVNGVVIPDWTTPVLRFSNDDIKGTALTPEEIAVFDVQKSKTLADPPGP